MEKLKKILPRLGICIGLLIIVWGVYFGGMKKLNQTIEGELADDFSWVVQVDEVRKEGNEFILEGFAFKLNQDAEDEMYEIVLHNLDTGEYYFPKMEYMERKDVNDYFLCEYDYAKSGFVARIKEKKLNLEDDYEILLRPEGTRKPYQFATYLCEGELMYVNPKDYVPLDVKGTDLEKIVRDGALRVFRPEVGMYVYQYMESLYWIAESKYEFDEYMNSRIEFQLETTQISKLPQERLINEWYWDNLGFDFKDNEVYEWELGEYRVACKKLPDEYSVTKMWTGRYEKDWMWLHDFRLRYDF